MTRITIRFASTLSIAAALAVGCGSSATEDTNTTAANQRGTGSDQRSDRGASSGGENGGNCGVDAVYFAYNSSELDGRARSTLESNAQCLNRRAGTANVVGMADPRGTEEYNLALGDRRARTVTGYMNNLGVDGRRMQVRSVGEEYATGRDEPGWSRDRRAEFEVR